MGWPAALAQIESDPFYGLYSLGWGLEVPLFVASAVLVARGLWRFFPLGAHRLFGRFPNPGLGIVRAAVLFAGAWFFFVLATDAASDIVGFYTWMYTFLAFAVLLYGSFAWPILDLYAPADVVERGNLAAGLALGGFALGTAFAFGGALTGEGPGWWIVIVFFAGAYWELRGNMALVSRIAGSLATDVRTERDASAGLLLGAVAVASGLVSGRAAAGDFTGWERDIPDYVKRLWGLLPIAFLGAAVGGLTRAREDRLAIRGAAAAAMIAFGFAVYFLT